MTLNNRIILGACGILLLGSSLAGCKKGSDEAERLLAEKDKELADLRQLAEMDRREMENEYAQFAAQYGELKMTIRDDSLATRLEAEQRRAQQLMEELKRVKSTNAAEILRLRRELETVRAVLRDYIRQVDSLQRLNQNLVVERDSARREVARARQENNTMAQHNASLSEKVAIAAQLNATGIHIQALKANGKPAKKMKDIKRFCISFTITRNVTAQAGNRPVYLRLMKPGKQVASPHGSFTYEGKQIEYSAVKNIEYSGQEVGVTMYVDMNEFISAGQYSVHIFTDGQMIGSGSINIGK